MSAEEHQFEISLSSLPTIRPRVEATKSEIPALEQKRTGIGQAIECCTETLQAALVTNESGYGLR